MRIAEIFEKVDPETDRKVVAGEFTAFKTC